MDHTDNPVEDIQDKCDRIPKESISFLVTSCSLKNGKIEIDLYRKESYRNQYLLPSSIHPTSVTKNIPFSLALRIIGTCTSPDIRDMRLTELRNMLMYREYPERLVSSAIDRARTIPDI